MGILESIRRIFIPASTEPVHARFPLAEGPVPWSVRETVYRHGDQVVRVAGPFSSGRDYFPAIPEAPAPPPDTIDTAISRVSRARDYFVKEDHTLNEAFDYTAANLKRSTESLHQLPSWASSLIDVCPLSSGLPLLSAEQRLDVVRAVPGGLLASGQLFWGIPVAMKDHVSRVIEASPRGLRYTATQGVVFPLEGAWHTLGFVGGRFHAWGDGSLAEQDSFSTAREVTLTLGAGGMLLMGARNVSRGGGNFFNSARVGFQNLGEMGFRPAPGLVAVASSGATIPASGLPELGVGICMMGANGSSASPPSSSELPEEPAPAAIRPDESLVRIPGREFIQGSQLPEISFGDEARLRRVRLSPISVLRSVGTNRLWGRYVLAFRDEPWAIIGRISNGVGLQQSEGRWGVVKRGISRAELEAWLADHHNGDRVYSDDAEGRVFDLATCETHRVIPEDALEHPEGFNHPDQPVVNIDWPRAVAAADGMGRILTRGSKDRTVSYDNTEATCIAYVRQQIQGAGVGELTQDLADASPGYLLTEAEWEGAARGPLEHITVAPSEFQAFVRGPQINGRYFEGTIPRRENFVQIIDPTTMEFGTEVFTDPNHPMVQDWLKNGVLGAWRVFAGDLEQGIWSSVFEERSATRSVLEEPENTFGLRGMNGNTWEWVNDWFGNYEAPANPGEAIRNPRGPNTGEYRVLRGSSWEDNLPRNVRAAYRSDYSPVCRDISFGLRFGVLPQD